MHSCVCKSVLTLLVTKKMQGLSRIVIIYCEQKQTARFVPSTYKNSPSLSCGLPGMFFSVSSKKLINTALQKPAEPYSPSKIDLDKKVCSKLDLMNVKIFIKYFEHKKTKNQTT